MLLMKSTINFALLLAGSAPVLSQPGLPSINYDNYRDSVSLSFTSPFSRSPRYTPSVRGMVAGRPFTFPLDTGSTGVMIGRDRLDNVPIPENAIAGWEFLDSSNHLYNGFFVDLNITYYGSTVQCLGYDATTDSGVCPEEKLNKTFNGRPMDVNYHGIGFGRNTPGSGLRFGTPSHNPFLNIISINDRRPNMRTGYIMSTDGVSLGITSQNTRGASWLGLENIASSDRRSWALPRVTFTINGRGPVTGTALFDTGITQMFLRSTTQVPIRGVRTARGWRARDGTLLDFSFRQGRARIAGYRFTVGANAPISRPDYVYPLAANGTSGFVNTGRNFYYAYSTAFDAIGGRLGFICKRCRT